jgi:serine/threonine protein kinase
MSLSVLLPGSLKNSAFWSGEHQCHIEAIVTSLTIPFCRTQIYGMVRDLHRVGIAHRDLEPQNVARVPGGGFRLIDFSESEKHTCKEFLVQCMATPFWTSSI